MLRGHLTRLLHFTSRLCVIGLRMFSTVNACLVLLKLIKGDTTATHYPACKIRQSFRSQVEINSTLSVFDAATLLKTEAGSVPDGKVKIRLESDGSLLDVDEDDVEKVFNHQIS